MMRPGAAAFDNPDDAVDQTAFGDGSTGVIGTPDDLVANIRKMLEITGGFGTVIGFAHDWANPEATLRSWDLVARYVMPEVNGMLEGYRESQTYVIEHRDVFQRAGEAVLSKIMENERAVAALKETQNNRAAMPAHHAPDLKR